MTKSGNSGSKFLVATAIPYANDRPHLGNAIDWLCADVLARYHRQQGSEVLFTTGTDEHGSKIAAKAAQQGISPQALVDQNTARFVQALPPLGITNDRFIRTTDWSHQEAVADIWRRLKPQIELGDFQGAYCSGCEAYKTPTVVDQTGGVCPDHLKPYQELAETNYFFRLGSFTDQIRELIVSDQLQIRPRSLQASVLHDLETGPTKISVSRPKESLQWGIPVPDDPDQIVYVWFEALMNYITVLGYPDGDDLQRFWPADSQIIGRDILYFHAVIWPAMLLALGLPVYRQLYAHGLITIGGQKMSKSLGNIIQPLELVERFGLDSFRNYFIGQIPSYQDGDYDFGRFIEVHNRQLVDTLGNLVYRLQALAQRDCLSLAGGKWPPVELDQPRPELDRLVGEALADCRFDQALAAIWAEIRFLNGYLEQTAPWKIDDDDRRRTILRGAIGYLLTTAKQLAPFLPDAAAIVEQVFGRGELKPMANPPFSKLDPVAEGVGDHD